MSPIGISGRRISARARANDHGVLRRPPNVSLPDSPVIKKSAAFKFPMLTLESDVYLIECQAAPKKPLRRGTARDLTSARGVAGVLVLVTPAACAHTHHLFLKKGGVALKWKIGSRSPDQSMTPSSVFAEMWPPLLFLSLFCPLYVSSPSISHPACVFSQLNECSLFNS